MGRAGGRGGGRPPAPSAAAPRRRPAPTSPAAREAAGIVELVRARLGDLTPAEQKVGRALVAAYPSAGLETVARLAERAAVSPPTVVRFATRLGFDGFGALQQALRDELDEREASPVSLAGAPRPGRAAPRTTSAPSGTLAAHADVVAEGVRRTMAELPAPEVELAVSLLADPRRRVTLAGGRFSRLLAHYLALHLAQLRDGVRVLPDGPVERAASLHDLARRDVVVLLDFRRYEPFAARLAAFADGRGASVVLVTDRWLSPAAGSAAAVLPVRVDSVSPYDSFVPALAVLEGLVALLVERLDPAATGRLRAFEATGETLGLW